MLKEQFVPVVYLPEEFMQGLVNPPALIDQGNPHDTYDGAKDQLAEMLTGASGPLGAGAYGIIEKRFTLE